MNGNMFQASLFIPSRGGSLLVDAAGQYDNFCWVWWCGVARQINDGDYDDVVVGVVVGVDVETNR